MSRKKNKDQNPSPEDLAGITLTFDDSKSSTNRRCRRRKLPEQLAKLPPLCKPPTPDEIGGRYICIEDGEQASPSKSKKPRKKRD